MLRTAWSIPSPALKRHRGTRSCNIHLHLPPVMKFNATHDVSFERMCQLLVSSAARGVGWCINEPQHVVPGCRTAYSMIADRPPQGADPPSGGLFLGEQFGLLDDQRDG